MKKTLLQLTAVLALGISSAFAHQDIEIGPNGGRILELSKDQSMQGELTVQGDKFHIELLDKNRKPVAIGEQMLTATAGDRNNPAKLRVEKQGPRFVVPTVKEGQWVIFQFKETPNAKTITARVQYQTKPCPECKGPEWLCACGAKVKKKK